MTYTLKPVPATDNNRDLLDRGSEIMTNRVLLTGTEQAITLPSDVKEVMVEFESGTVVGTVRGTLPGTKITLDNEAAESADAGASTELNADANALVVGTEVIIEGTAHYDGTHTLLTPSDANHIKIGVAYVAETIPGTATALGFRTANITADGVWHSWPICKQSDTAVIYLTGSDYCSITAWR